MNKFIQSKPLVFLTTVVVGLILTCGSVVKEGFSGVSIRDWAIDGLFAAAVLGFLVSKFLEFKGIWEKHDRGATGGCDAGKPDSKK